MDLYDLIDKTFEENSNYTSVKTGEGDTAAVYFSSNGIFFPDTEACFTETILQKDRFEWKKNLIPEASLHIFVRDLKKSWYLGGINNRCDSIPATVELLRSLTQGYRIITMGSSAGGYAAALFGSLLGAQKVYCFSAQFSIEYVKELSYHYFSQLCQLDENQKYMNIVPILEKFSVPIYYFYPALWKNDIEQAELVRDLPQVRVFPVKSAEHGIAVSYTSMTYILRASGEDLDRLQNKCKIFDQQYFFLKLVPWYKLPLIVCKKICRRFITFFCKK